MTLVILEQRAAKWSRISFEALIAGAQIGEPLEAVVIGHDVGALAEEAAAYPVQKVLVLDDAALADYTPDAYTTALEQLIKAKQPGTVVFPHTYQVRDYAPKLSARLDQVLISDVIG